MSANRGVRMRPAAVIAVALVSSVFGYVAIFALIHGVQPSWLLDSGGYPRLVYTRTFWPLRWLTADRFEFMPRIAPVWTVDGRFEEVVPAGDRAVVVVGGETLRVDADGDIDPRLRRGDPIRLRCRSSLVVTGGFHDRLIFRVLAIERR